MRAIRNILLVYKKSYLELHQDQARLKRLHVLPKASLEKIYRADEENRLTKERVIRVLARRGLHFDILWRGHLDRSKRYDLIVTVGGDGTFLAASHISRGTPIMAVNSDPHSSVALFATADRSTFEKRLDQLLKGKVPAVRLARMEIRINGKRIPENPLNDVLFAHENPAAMTRYVMQIGSVREEQKSSGVWCSTAAGSTAAILAAGGRVMPITARSMQYRVREPYQVGRKTMGLLSGIIKGPVCISTLARKAGLFVDGHRTAYPLHLGDRVVIGMSRDPLVVYGIDPIRRKKLFG